MARIRALISNLRMLSGGCSDCARQLSDLRHDSGCDRERCQHNLQALSCGGASHDTW